MNLIPKFTLGQLLLWMIAATFVVASLANAIQGGLIGTVVIFSFMAGIGSWILLALFFWVWYAIAIATKFIFENKRSRSRLNGFLLLWVLANYGGCQPNAYSQVTNAVGGNGYKITVDNLFPRPNTEGARWPVRVTAEIEPAGVAPVDRPLVVFISSFPIHGGLPFVVSAPLMIKQGAASASVEILLPIREQQRTDFQFEIFEGTNLTQGNYRNRIFSEHDYLGAQADPLSPAILLISSKLPAASYGMISIHLPGTPPLGGRRTAPPVLVNEPNLKPLIDVYHNEGTSSNAPPLIGNTERRMRYCHPNTLPQTWVGLSGIQQIFISQDGFQELMQDVFARQVIQQWMAAGGVLVVYGLDELFSQGSDCWGLLEGGDNRAESSGPTPVAKAWKALIDVPYPHEHLFDAFVGGNANLLLHQNNYVHDEFEKAAQNRVKAIASLSQDSEAWWQRYSLPLKSEIDAKFLVRGYLRGGMVLVNSDLSDWQQQDWIASQNALEIMPTGLNSLMANQGSNFFAPEFAIAGVGELPLRSFQILLSLFLFLAGPLVYFVLWRSQNMQWLFVLVPLVSLTASLGLIANALLVDGLGTHARLRSVTWLDQTQQMGVTQARATYYRGLPPPRTLHRNDTLIQLAEHRYQRSKLRIQQQDEGVVLFGGWFLARQLYQMVSLRAHFMPERIEWLADPTFVMPKSTTPDADQQSADQPSENEESGPLGTLVNRLGNPALLIIVNTGQGLVAVENIDNDRSAKALAVDAAWANEKVAEIMEQISPRQFNQNALVGNQRPGWFQRNEFPMAMGEWGVIQQLKSKAAVQFLAEPGGYMAILSEFDSVAPQVESLKYLDQVHVIIGKW